MTKNVVTSDMTTDYFDSYEVLVDSDTQFTAAAEINNRDIFITFTKISVGNHKGLVLSVQNLFQGLLDEHGIARQFSDGLFEVTHKNIEANLDTVFLAIMHPDVAQTNYELINQSGHAWISELAARVAAQGFEKYPGQTTINGIGCELSAILSDDQMAELGADLKTKTVALPTPIFLRDPNILPTGLLGLMAGNFDSLQTIAEDNQCSNSIAKVNGVELTISISKVKISGLSGLVLSVENLSPSFLKIGGNTERFFGGLFKLIRKNIQGTDNVWVALKQRTIIDEHKNWLTNQNGCMWLFELAMKTPDLNFKSCGAGLFADKSLHRIASSISKPRLATLIKDIEHEIITTGC